MTTSPATLHTPRYVAEVLKVDVLTVRRWLREGTMKGIKIGEGKHWRISQEELNRVLQERIG